MLLIHHTSSAHQLKKLPSQTTDHAAIRVAFGRFFLFLCMATTASHVTCQKPGRRLSVDFLLRSSAIARLIASSVC
jgi:hypothetical protein